MVLQDVSTMIRYRLNPIIFLINNGGYTIEVEIHDGPYNNIQGWDYSGLVQCFDNHQGNVFSTKVRAKQLSSLLLSCVCYSGSRLGQVLNAGQALYCGWRAGSGLS